MGRKPAVPLAIVPKRKRGGQTKHTPELAKIICDRIAKGESLREISRDSGMPPASTVCEWVVDDRDGFAEQYMRARMAQAVLMAEDIMAISDDESKDVTGELAMPNTVAYQRSRLKVDTRKWYLSKVLPKVYGDRIGVEHGVTVELAEVIARARKRQMTLAGELPGDSE